MIDAKNDNLNDPRVSPEKSSKSEHELRVKQTTSMLDLSSTQNRRHSALKHRASIITEIFEIYKGTEVDNNDTLPKCTFNVDTSIIGLFHTKSSNLYFILKGMSN